MTTNKVKIWIPKDHYQTWTVLNNPLYKTHFKYFVKYFKPSDNRTYALNWSAERYGHFNYKGDLSKYRYILLQDASATDLTQDNTTVVFITNIKYNSGNKLTNQQVTFEVDPFYKIRDYGAIKGQLSKSNLPDYTYTQQANNYVNIARTIYNQQGEGLPFTKSEEVKVIDTYLDKKYVYIADNKEQRYVLKAYDEKMVKDRIIRTPANILNTWFDYYRSNFTPIMKNRVGRGWVFVNKETMLRLENEDIDKLKREFENDNEMLAILALSNILKAAATDEKWVFLTFYNYSPNSIKYKSSAGEDYTNNPVLPEMSRPLETQNLKEYLYSKFAITADEIDIYGITDWLSDNRIPVAFNEFDSPRPDYIRLVKRVEELLKQPRREIINKSTVKLSLDTTVDTKRNLVLSLHPDFNRLVIMGNNIVREVNIYNTSLDGMKDQANYNYGTIQYTEIETAESGLSYLKYKDNSAPEVEKYLANYPVFANAYEEYIKQNAAANVLKWFSPLISNIPVAGTLWNNIMSSTRNARGWGNEAWIRETIAKEAEIRQKAGDSYKKANKQGNPWTDAKYRESQALYHKANVLRDVLAEIPTNGDGEKNSKISFGLNIGTTVAMSIWNTASEYVKLYEEQANMRAKDYVVVNSVGEINAYQNDNKALRLIKLTPPSGILDKWHLLINKTGWLMNESLPDDAYRLRPKRRCDYIQMELDDMYNITAESNSELKNLFRVGVWIINDPTVDWTDYEHNKRWEEVNLDPHNLPEVNML